MDEELQKALRTAERAGFRLVARPPDTVLQELVLSAGMSMSRCAEHSDAEYERAKPRILELRTWLESIGVVTEADRHQWNALDQDAERRITSRRAAMNALRETGFRFASSDLITVNDEDLPRHLERQERAEQRQQESAFRREELRRQSAFRMEEMRRQLEDMRLQQQELDERVFRQDLCHTGEHLKSECPGDHGK